MPTLGPGILTVAIVVGSAFIDTGAWLLATLPLSPVIYGFLLVTLPSSRGR